MKKTISIFIASVILAMSVFSVNAFASTPKTDALLDKLAEIFESRFAESFYEEDEEIEDEE